MQPVIVKKYWGETRCIFSNETTEVWHAEILEGKTSSIHMHESKINQFYVVSGKLRITYYVVGRYNAVPIGGIELSKGQKSDIEPGTWHQFEALTHVELIEIYNTKPINSTDIVRFDFDKPLS